jgi:hypothetical protein
LTHGIAKTMLGHIVDLLLLVFDVAIIKSRFNSRLLRVVLATPMGLVSMRTVKGYLAIFALDRVFEVIGVFLTHLPRMVYQACAGQQLRTSLASKFFPTVVPVMVHAIRSYNFVATRASFVRCARVVEAVNLMLIDAFDTSRECFTVTAARKADR